MKRISSETIQGHTEGTLCAPDAGETQGVIEIQIADSQEGLQAPFLISFWAFLRTMNEY